VLVHQSGRDASILDQGTVRLGGLKRWTKNGMFRVIKYLGEGL
jgi:hypothetical protein